MDSIRSTGARPNPDYEDDGAAAPSQSIAPVPFFLWTRKVTFQSTEFTGKWCVIRPAETVDALWAKVREAVLAGRFPAALVSSATQAATYGGSYVICLFTPDWFNVEDVTAAREFLRELGVVEEIGYKRDIETVFGVYGVPEEWKYRA